MADFGVVLKIVIVKVVHVTVTGTNNHKYYIYR